MLAGFGAGWYKDPSELPKIPGEVISFEPQLEQAAREDDFQRWVHAIEVSRNFSGG
jgi:glycerol kinase